VHGTSRSARAVSAAAMGCMAQCGLNLISARTMECDSRAQFTIPKFLTTDNRTENKNFSWEMKPFKVTGMFILTDHNLRFIFVGTKNKLQE